MFTIETSLEVDLVVFGQEFLITQLLHPIDNLFNERDLNVELFRNPFGNEQPVRNIVREESTVLVNHVGSILKWHHRGLDLTQRRRIGEGALDVRSVRLVDKALEIQVV